MLVYLWRTMIARCFILSAALLVGCGSVAEPRPGIALATAYQDDAYARTLIGRSITSKDGQLPDTSQAFSATEEMKSTVVGGGYTNDQKLVRALKASFKGAVQQSCGASANAMLGTASDSDIDIEWKLVAEALDNQRAYEPLTAICNDDGKVASSYIGKGVITTVFKTKITLHSKQSGGAAAGAALDCKRGAAGIQGEISINVSQDGHTTITSDGWNFVKVEPVSSSCQAWHRHHVHVMNEAQKILLRSVASRYSKALLDSYQCHWMFGGVLVMDKICPSGMCPNNGAPLAELYKLYSMPVAALVSSHGDTICASVKQTMQSLGISGNFLGDCNTSSIRGWIARHQGDRYRDITRKVEVSAQIDLLRAIISPESRAEVASAWANLPQGQEFFRSASQTWGQLRDLCAPGGCATRIFTGSNTDESLTTLVSWPTARDKLFAAWLSVFSGQSMTSPDFAAGCHGAVMELDSGRWTYKGTGNQTCDGRANCLSFGNPSHTDAASDWFATTIVK